MNQQTERRLEKGQFKADKFLRFLESSEGLAMTSQPKRRKPQASSPVLKINVPGKTKEAIKIDIQSVTGNAGMWVLSALLELQKLAIKHPGQEVMAEEIRQYFIPLIGDAPNDARAWGGLMRIACKAGIVKNTKKKRPAVTSNGGPKVVWRLRVPDHRLSVEANLKSMVSRFVKDNRETALAR